MVATTRMTRNRHSGDDEKKHSHNDTTANDNDTTTTQRLATRTRHMGDYNKAKHDNNSKITMNLNRTKCNNRSILIIDHKLFNSD